MVPLIHLLARQAVIHNIINSILHHTLHFERKNIITIEFYHLDFKKNLIWKFFLMVWKKTNMSRTYIIWRL